MSAPGGLSGSRCVAGDGSFYPRRERCPACGRPAETVTLPAAGHLLAATSFGDRTIGVVRFGDATAPAVVVGPVAEGDRVTLVEGEGDLLVARPR